MFIIVVYQSSIRTIHDIRTMFTMHQWEGTHNSPTVSTPDTRI